MIRMGEGRGGRKEINKDRKGWVIKGKGREMT